MAGAESPDFSAIIMLCDLVACPEGKALYPAGSGVTGCPFTSPAVRVYW